MQEKIAYFAGFFDGEGCVGRYFNNGRLNSPRVEVRIVNTHLPILEELKQAYGGHVYTRKKTPRRHKPAYDWVMVGKEEVNQFLQEIYPYLVVKKQEVQNALTHNG